MKKILFFISIYLLNFNILLAGETQKTQGLPQLDYTTFSEQVFWFLIIFGILYLFISKYAIPKIKSIQNSRERVIQQNNNNNIKYSREAEKVKNIISFQISNAQESSKNSLKKLDGELRQIEDKKLNEVKNNNNKIKETLNNELNSIDQNFLNNIHSHLNEITTILLNKLDITLSKEIINQEIRNHIFSIKDTKNV